MKGRLIKALSILFLTFPVVAVDCQTPAYSAEITGTVSVDYKGLFEAAGNGHAHPISVALLPDEHQDVTLRKGRTERIEIVGNRMTPSFLTIQIGDKIEFLNRDSVFHQIFSLSQGQPLTAQLGRTGTTGKDKVVVQLDQPGVTHFFCRIHNKSYARVDVVNSPYVQTIQAGQAFHFSGLSAGRWKLRLASPATETRIIEVSAVTAPPPVHFTLASHDGGAGGGRFNSRSDVEQLYKTNDH